MITKPATGLNTYGSRAKGQTQLHYDRWAFSTRRTIEEGAIPRHELLRGIINSLWPKTDWNPWLERIIEKCCTQQWIGLSGCGSAGKTHGVALYAVAWWLAKPGISSVILTSTTMGAIRKRAWPVIQSLYSSIPGERIGNFLDHKTMWQSRKGDDKHALSAVPVADGNTLKAIDYIKGIHTERQLLIIDEGEATPDAAFGVIDNLIGSPIEFQVIVMGNPRNRLVSFGSFCEPRDGWTSVTVEDQEWETADKLNGKPAIIVRFDAEKSPNIEAGRTIWPYLPTLQRVNAVRKARGGGNHPAYWTEYRGFWPPDGISRTVFSETAIETFRARDPKHNFIGKIMFVVGGLDPAFSFGGDKAAIQFARCGDIGPDVIGIELYPTIVIPLNSSSTNPLNYQIAERARELCDQFKCPPENLCLDASGGGGGTCDIMARLWSNRIIRVQFGGSPSERPVSLEDMRMCREVYNNKVTEMYFNAKEFVYAGQIRGLSQETSMQLCTREYEDQKKLIALESKRDYKKRTNRESPDEADAFVLCLEAARNRGVVPKAVGETEMVGQEISEQVALLRSVYESVDYSEANDMASLEVLDVD